MMSVPNREPTVSTLTAVGDAEYYSSTYFEYLYATKVFLLYTTIYFYSITDQRQILYFFLNSTCIFRFQILLLITHLNQRLN